MAVGEAGVLREGLVWWPEEISNTHGMVSHPVVWVIQGDFPSHILVYMLTYLGGSLSHIFSSVGDSRGFP